MAEVSRRAASSLPEELLVEVLARVPYRSLCRFRPSPASSALDDLREDSLCHALDDNLRERYVSSIFRPLVDPSLPFLRVRGGGYTHGFILVDCCGGLLLCACFTSPTQSHRQVDYLVCNPATEKWSVLPRTEGLHSGNLLRLGHDPADPSRFTVFVLLRHHGNDDQLTGVEIYSSQTRRWTSKQSGWPQETSVGFYEAADSVFLDGTLHLSAPKAVTVDMDGKTWQEIPRPFLCQGCIGQSQRRLHAVKIDHVNDNGRLLSVWVLKDYASGHWTLKHTASISELLGRRRHLRGYGESYTLIGIHPDCDLIFFIDEMEGRFMSYAMDSRKVHVVYNQEEYYREANHPYTPCFAECSTTR
ncbi:hypothetical protein TRIUR3_01032 [Triticum urartu]|uniref:F-box domain-containing protein n=1 Tax=Triticum urartu TaxID=4572 RepID=M8A5V5_TRIUA|nr:hypothetical protein TRIUR3_01032 [Triticum urartu]